ncbi:amino acid permease [Corynebacterium belfantii]|uniref:aromatic amino acid transport family protein n=1 Tax=Corynebacterium belfantii TaxID=2014537 RepID=UPI000B4AD4C1|nr:amino acid permease [Corynebacterium belfantii]OWM39649.1 amino acid permease [Corynebacterium diphtheriae subsp. lausannense]MBG9259529.1 amino acid permease [Corynebacterium belfantii]MBG9266285.1 amino acid permease [Corynebacterium belfantii]MBG9350713.1 amino acid permease [Corynebacterium belfantii]SNW32292.1 Tyrosine-specific transport protein [Corynebacterium belfantii]
MSTTTTVSAREDYKESHVSPLQGVALIFGTNIGAGILSLPYAGRNGGFLALFLALVIAGTLTTISMLYVAEVSLRTKRPMQLSGLAEQYLGNWGRWAVFVAIMVNGTGALIAYAAGSGELLNNLVGIPPIAGTLIFFVIGSIIMYKGLEATGVSELLITTAMALIIFILCGWTFIGPGISLSNVWVFNPYFIIPIMNLAVFTFMAQYVVPELARGMEKQHSAQISKAIIAGMVVTGFMLSLVPFAALGLLGQSVSEVVTLSWGEKLGQSAYYMANVFALLAMFTSFMAIGYTTMRNVIDIAHWPQHGKQRAIAVLITVLIPLFISLAGFGGFVSALSYAGGLAGVIMSIVPVLLLNASRVRGDRDPAWTVGWSSHPLIQWTIILVYGLAGLYSVGTILGIVPAGWQ